MPSVGERQQSVFEQLGERCQQIEAVAMDMNTAFDLEVTRRWLDLFHVVGGQVVGLEQAA